MKTLTYIFVLILLGTAVLNAQSNFHNIHYLDPYNPEYVAGEVLVKFKDEVLVQTSIRSDIAKTGVTTADVILEPYQLESITKVFKETREQRQRKSIRTIRDFKGNEIEVPALFNIYKLKFDTIWDIDQIIEDLQKDPNIQFAEPNYLVYTNEVIESGIVPKSPPKQTPLPLYIPGSRDITPNDPLYSQQWYLPAINAPAAWDSVTGDTTQIIAIIDTGVDWDHPDLDDNIWTNWNEIPDNGIDDDANGYIDDTRGWDYINNDNDPNDDNSHGTHVAGIAAAEGNNGIGMCGVAWNALIMPIKMLQSSGSGNSSDLASAIVYASDNGATVINMSLGSYANSGAVKIALENAYAGTGDGEGSMLVAAAGNDRRRVDLEGPSCKPYAPMFPAAYSWVLGVMANDAGGCLGWSNWDFDGPIAFGGFNYEIQAKGVGILSCKPNGGYWIKTGTSMASPEIAGAVALMRQFRPDNSGEEIFAKLIQGSNSGLIDIYSSLTIILVPDLYYIDFDIVDTLPGCDNDGIADAGETIELIYTIKNAGGLADSVWTKIRFGEFEDTTTATLIDTTSLIGSMSAYSTMTTALDPIIIKIDSNVVHNRDIVFEIELNNGSNLYQASTFVITIANGEELSGVMDSLLILSKDKFWVVNNSFKIGPNGVLRISPGTFLKLDQSIINIGLIEALGTKDSLIIIEGPGSIIYDASSYGNINFSYVTVENIFGEHAIRGQGGNISNSIFQNFQLQSDALIVVSMTIQKSIFRNIMMPWSSHLIWSVGSEFSKCSFTEIEDFYGVPIDILFTGGQNLKVSNSNFNINGRINTLRVSNQDFVNNNLLSNKTIVKASTGIYDSLSQNYWGTNNENIISSKIYDFWEDPTLAQLIWEPKNAVPSNTAMGCVWKVEIDSVDPQDEYMDALGSGQYRFDVYFNRPMDTTFAPLLTFGVREPYTQHIVRDSVRWNSDSTIWSAYRTIDMTTGDGIQRIRVYGAKDTDGFEIPIENSRFEFVIQAAAAASIEFYATPGIGKVELEWPPTSSEDALGYNLYRSYNLTDSTYSDTLMINTELILDTVYTDYNVIPDTTYHYFYKTLGTDLIETDFSKRVTATPFNAANGDANGDLAVNVLDITTIVSYMLNQNPSPFLFDAADVNYDNDINVLDIIGLVQLINGGKSLTTKPLPELSKQTAYYIIKDNVIQFESKGNVAAIQFKLRATNLQPETRNLKLETLRIFSLQQGFEFAYAVVDDHIIGILYSFTSRELPEHISDLFRFEGVNISDIEITEIFGGDLNGNYVPVIKKGTNSVVFSSDAQLTASPNPFTYSTQINYTVPENGIVEIKLFDLSGTKISQLENTFQNAGKYSLNWNSTNHKGRLLKSGIYLLQLKVRSVSGNNYNKEVKVVMTK